MILVNTDYIAGKELEMLGLVKGSTIQSKNLGKEIVCSETKSESETSQGEGEKSLLCEVFCFTAAPL